MPQAIRPTHVPSHTLISVALLVALGLSACGKDEETAAPAEASVAPAAGTTPPEASPVDAATAALLALPVPELKQRASAALNEQRLHSPAGNNAMEFHLAIRQKAGAQTDVATEEALTDLLPYALIAAEKAVGDENFEEAERLLSLMERADPQAPSLPRVREAMAEARNAITEREAEQAERQRLAEEQRAREAEAARQAAANPTPAPTPAAPQPEAPKPEPTPAPTAEAAPVAAAPVEPPKPAAPVINRNPRPISQPQPQYPREAARAGTAGQVVVRYTIGADGRVTDVQIVSSRPRGVFDGAVRTAVQRWRFEAPGEPVTQTRTLDFRM